jgi:hypothetical protein
MFYVIFIFVEYFKNIFCLPIIFINPIIAYTILFIASIFLTFSTLLRIKAEPKVIQKTLIELYIVLCRCTS